LGKTKNILKQWLPLVVVITALCGLVYATVQQAFRHIANDPQIQMAEDAAQSLGKGALTESVLPANQIDVALSGSPFMIIFDDAGVSLASSGLLDGKVPAIPPGVFEYVRQKGEDRITWQPEPGVRLATVVVNYSGDHPGFVLVARSLSETEKRVDQMGILVIFAWIAAVISTLLMVILGELFISDKQKS
jgi:hypothetical protein